MKKVCMAVTNGFTNDQRVFREAQTLSKNGYEVTVVAFKDENTNLAEEEILDGLKVLRIKKKNSSNQKGLKLLFSKLTDLPKIVLYGSSFTPALQSLLIEQKADIYHAHDLDTLLASYNAAIKNKARIVYDSHEIFLEALKEWKEEIKETKDPLKLLGAHLVEFKLAKIEKSLISKVDEVITINDSIADFLTKKYNLSKKPKVLMSVTQIFNSSFSNKLREEFFLSKEVKIVLFQGMFGRVRGLDKTIAAMENVEGAVLILMGDGSNKEELVSLVKEMGLEKKVLFHPLVPPKELLNYTASADVGVIPYRKTSLNNFFCTPNKIFEYMMAGIPMVVSDFPELKKFAQMGIGETFDPEKPESIANAIRKILGSGLEEKKSRARKLALERYNWEVESKKLLDIYSLLK